MKQAESSLVKILLIDDMEENLLVLETLLAGSDIELLKARSGREALELLLEHNVALALIDVQMPEMDGFELAELMRGTSRTSNVPIIFVTAGIQERGRIFRGYDAGAVDFLFKPIEPRVLRNKVQVFVELFRQRKELEKTLRLNEELIAVVSHDLRNPLNLILMTAKFLTETQQDASVQGAAQKIVRSTNRIVSIIGDLLDLSRARLGGGIPVERAPCNLLEVTEATVEEFRGTSPLSVVLVEPCGNLEGQWDRSRLEQVLSNLIGNALKHGLEERPVRVVLNGERHESVTITVHNEGNIALSTLPGLFEPFVAERRGDGLGLGLYIVRQIALAHDGDVAVQSSPEAGTSFTVTLPRSAPLSEQTAS